MNNIVVSGASGQLGHELCRQLGACSVPMERAHADFTNAASIRRFFADIQVSAVINTAAYTHVDRAELHPEDCERINVEAVAVLADVCEQRRIPLVQISTDYVFGEDHARSRPYEEHDLTGPLNVYGASKRNGELAAQRCSRSITVRTCGLYAAPGNGLHTNFVRSILSAIRNNKPLRVVDDQRCCPTFVPHAAKAIVDLLRNQMWGTWHVVNNGNATWHEFAVAVLDQAGIRVEVLPIPSTSYQSLAVRPAYSVLSGEKMRQQCGISMPHWRCALEECLRLTA